MEIIMQKILNSKSYKIIIVILLVSFTGCVTSRIETVSSENLPKKKTYRIRIIYLNDYRAIDVADKEAKLKINYKDKGNAVIYYENVNEEKFILLNDISYIEIEVLESNETISVLFIAGTIALVTVILYLLISPLGKFKAG